MIKIEAYPWAVPTEEQKALFDSLSPEQQLDRLRQAIIKGEESGAAEPLDMEKYARELDKKQVCFHARKNPKPFQKSERFGRGLCTWMVAKKPPIHNPIG